MTKRALIHVDDSENIVEFTQFLASTGWTILSANKTEELLRKNHIPVTRNMALSSDMAYAHDISRVITDVVSTKIPDYEYHTSLQQEEQTNNIFIVCINIQPFYYMANSSFDLKSVDYRISSILRYAFYNYENVLVITDPQDYKEVILQLRTEDISDDFRTYLAAKALNLVSAYDAGLSASILQSPKFNEPFMNYMMLPFKRELQLHCGMNAQQSAYLYKSPAEEGSVGNFLKYQGKDLTYTLVNDISYAWRQINSLFTLLKNQPTVKSTNSDGYEFTTQFTPLTGTVFSLAVKFGTILGASHATNVLESFKSTFTYDSVTTTDTVFACSAVINGEAAEEILKRLRC